MARIKNIELPKEKRIVIGLTYIYGIGRSLAETICEAAGVNPDIKVKDLDMYEKYLISFVRLSLRKLDYLLVDNIFNKLTEEEGDALLQLIEDVFLCDKTTTIIVSDTYKKVQSVCTRAVNFESGSIVEE